MFVKFHGLVAGSVVELKVVHLDLMRLNFYDKTTIEMRYKEYGDEKLFRKAL